MNSLVAVPELRVLIAFGDGPATADQVATTLEIDAADARARLGHCVHFLTVKARTRHSVTEYRPTSSGRVIRDYLRTMEADLFRGSATDAQWQAYVDALPAEARPPLPDGFLQFANPTPEDQAPIPELAVLPHLKDGARTAADVAAAMEIDTEEAERVLRWCRDAFLVKVVAGSLGTYYALTKQGHTLSHGDVSPSVAVAKDLRLARVASAGVRRQRAERASDHLDGPSGTRRARLVLAVVGVAAAMLWWIFADPDWPGFLLFAAGWLSYSLPCRRNKPLLPTHDADLA